MLNGFFASKTITALDGSTSIPGGWIDGNWKQLYIQFGYVCATCVYSFAVTANIANGLNRIPGLGLRATEEAEKLGMDEAEVRLHVINVVFFMNVAGPQIGEFAADYIELQKDIQVSSVHEFPKSQRVRVSVINFQTSHEPDLGGELQREQKGNEDQDDETGVHWNLSEKTMHEIQLTQR